MSIMEISSLLGANRITCPSLHPKPGSSGARISIGPRSSVRRKLKAVAEYDEQKQSARDRWRGLAFDTSDDQQDITRGKGMVDTLFQASAGSGGGTHYAVMSSYDYISAGLHR